MLRDNWKPREALSLIDTNYQHIHISYLQVESLSLGCDCVDHSPTLNIIFYFLQPSDTKVYITGYGVDAEYPEEGLTGVEQLRADQYITLWDEETSGR